MNASLTEHLVSVDEPALATLLNKRPDTLRGAEPRDLSELTERLNHPASLVAVLSRLPLPCLQVAEALAALGEGASTDRLLSFLDNSRSSERGHEADVDDVLSQLYAVAVAWPGEQGRIRMPAGLGAMFGRPLGLGQPLRGADYRAPFSAQPPATPSTEVNPDAVESESAVAATAFAGHTLAILDRVHRSPLARVKSGGVGVRELTRLAKTVACGEVEARLSLELAHASGLLEVHAEGVVTSEQFAHWRAQEPGIRFAALLRAWWRLGRTPSEARDDEGKSIPTLSPLADCAGCREARVALFDETAKLTSGKAADRASVPAAMLWRRPLLHGSPQDSGMPFSTLWQEAELLGLLAHNAISCLGRVLLEGNAAAIVRQATTLLPHSSDQASFGTDLTAMVVGAPSARVSSLLDACADREGRGGATIWRASPASVRRALDNGATGDELERLLSSIATAELPQPLRYLIADVARRHGLLRVSPAISVIRSEDTALLAEVAVDRKLKKLGLRLLAPTLLACDVPADEALAAMRTAGYFPVPERRDDAGPQGASDIPAGSGAGQPGTPSEIVRDNEPGDGKTLEFQTHLGARPQKTAAEPADPESVAARLVGKRQRPLRVAPSGTEAELGHLNRRLPDSEVRQLAHAIDQGQPAVIEYVSASGRRTLREISEIQLVGGTLFAMCELRQDDRAFTVSRILSVSPAP